MSKENKKIYCIFAAQYFPHLGGVEFYVYHLAKKLIDRGNQVVIVTSNVQRISEYEITEDGIEIFRLPCINVLDGRYPVLKFWSHDFARLYKRIKSYPFSLIVVNTRFYLHSVCGVRMGKRQRIKTIVIDHGTSHLSVHNPFWDAVGSWWEHLITKVDRLYCDDYYGVSLASAKWLKHFKITPKGVLYNAINIEDIEEEKKKDCIDYRVRFDIPKSAKVIVFTGRLLEEKGIKQLIQAVSHICRSREDVYLFLAGDGDLEDYVKDHAGRHIIPTGRLNTTEIVHLLETSDIFCLPSVSEGFPTSVLEAVACNCYIITTARGGTKELIKGADYGTIIPKNDTELIQEALEKIIDDEERIISCCRKSYQRLIRNFTWNKTADKIEKIVSE